ncbi:hypothetical protein AB5J52_48790 (plasmid) [Streptomyces sp. R39]|uniref:Uncharacterized protein n=1 Tax=Streptomyces sp. R39 TaxID=3238631 RepID=A0AB39R4Z9_9ACTN
MRRLPPRGRPGEFVKTAGAPTSRAIPLLHGGYTDAAARKPYADPAELARVADWSALGMGHHALAPCWSPTGRLP